MSPWRWSAESLLCTLASAAENGINSQKIFGITNKQHHSCIWIEGFEMENECHFHSTSISTPNVFVVVSFLKHFQSKHKTYRNFINNFRSFQANISLALLVKTSQLPNPFNNLNTVPRTINPKTWNLFQHYFFGKSTHNRYHTWENITIRVWRPTCSLLVFLKPSLFVHIGSASTAAGSTRCFTPMDDRKLSMQENRAWK